MMEYKKTGCETLNGDVCSYCSTTPWVGPSMTRVPRPMPDHDRLPAFHYLPVCKTPTNVDGKERETDDYSPRANLKKLFADGKLTIDDTENIEAFANNFVTKNQFVEQYLTHLTNLKHEQNMRVKDRIKAKEAKKDKGVEMYKWDELVQAGKVGKLTVAELDKYLKHHSLSHRGWKCDKVRRIIAHVSQNHSFDGEVIVEDEVDNTEDDEQVLAVIGDDTDSDSDTLDSSGSGTDSDVPSQPVAETESEAEGPIIATTSRSGRQIKAKQYNDFMY